MTTRSKKEKKHQPYNQYQRAAEKSGPGSRDAYRWYVNLLRRIAKEWAAPDTATPSDIDLLDEVNWALGLERRKEPQAWPGVITVREEEHDITATYSNPRSKVILQMANASLTPMPGSNCNTWVVNRVFVPENLRRKGIGKRLLREAIVKAVFDRGAKKIAVCPGGYTMKLQEQVAFYLACGFKITPVPEVLEWELKDQL